MPTKNPIKTAHAAPKGASLLSAGASLLSAVPEVVPGGEESSSEPTAPPTPKKELVPSSTLDVLEKDREGNPILGWVQRNGNERIIIRHTTYKDKGYIDIRTWFEPTEKYEPKKGEEPHIGCMAGHLPGKGISIPREFSAEISEMFRLSRAIIEEEDGEMTYRSISAGDSAEAGGTE